MYLSVAISEALGVMWMSLFCFIQLPKLCQFATLMQPVFIPAGGFSRVVVKGTLTFRKSTLYWDTCSMIWVVPDGSFMAPLVPATSDFTNRRTAFAYALSEASRFRLATSTSSA